MEERIFDRLVKFQKYKNLNAYRFEEMCGLSHGTFGGWKKGRSDVGWKAISIICNHFKELNRDWLMSGNGEMLNPEKPKRFQDVETINVQSLFNENEEYETLKKRIEFIEDQVKSLMTLLESMNKNNEEVYSLLLKGL